MCWGTGREAKDVGIRPLKGSRCVCPLSRARGLRKVIATCNRDGIAEHGSLMFPEVLRQAPGEGISARLIVPHVGKVLQSAPMG